LIIEIERQRRPMLIVAHNAVIRTLYGYFTEVPAHEIPRLPMPLHTVIELSPRAYGLSESRNALMPGKATES
jgi:broad specificity phosphatase PhoE